MEEQAERFHINPETGLPNRCDDGEVCTFGGADFHYPNKHDAQVAWRARQLERGIVAYRNVMRKKEQDEEDEALARLSGRAKGISKKLSWGVVRSIAVKNLSKYVVNFLGMFTAYAVASGKWLTADMRRLVPTTAAIVFVALVGWFGIKLYKGSRKAAKVVQRRRATRPRRTTVKKAAPRPGSGKSQLSTEASVDES